MGRTGGLPDRIRRGRETRRRPAIEPIRLRGRGRHPGGIAAAVTAARMGRSVALVEENAHLGGMSASGLGKSDIENRAAIRGFFAEFVERVHRCYLEKYGPDSENVRLCREGYYYEPSVAEATFDRMVEEQPSISLLKSHRFQSTITREGTACGVLVQDRRTGVQRQLPARIVIDATYEGDAYASAGARYRLGRESRDEFAEPHAGVIYYDYRKRVFLSGSTGEGDRRLPAYTYRLCLTTDPDNAHPLSEPPPTTTAPLTLATSKTSSRGAWPVPSASSPAEATIRPISTRWYAPCPCPRFPTEKRT